MGRADLEKGTGVITYLTIDDVGENSNYFE